jgi:hypothetical protein
MKHCGLRTTSRQLTGGSDEALQLGGHHHLARKDTLLEYKCK